MIYYLLSKEDFAALYKFGEVNIKVGAAAESENPREAVKRLFSASDSFEYAQERLIVSSEKGSPGNIRMLDVKDIFPLDGISKNLFKAQFNDSIIFREPVFQDLAEDFLKNTVMERTTVYGINALRAVFGLGPEKNDELVKDIIKGKSFLRKFKYFDVPFEDRTPYSMLIAYNRYQHYPKDNRGFFYDAADCFMYGSMYLSLIEKGIPLLGYDREIVAHLCHSFFELLESLPSNTQFTKLASIIEDSNPKIGDAIAPVYGSIRFLALYFYVKEQIREEDTVSMKGLSLLNSVGKKYPEDFPRLLTILGGFLGYTWVYDRLYEFQGCPFLAVHHSPDDFQPIVSHQPEVGPIPSDDVSAPLPEQESPSSESAQEASTVQLDTPTSEASSETQPETKGLVDAIEGSSEEPTIPTTEPTVSMEEDFTTVPDSQMRHPDAEQPIIEKPKLELDVSHIIQVVFYRCSQKRKVAFEAKLKEYYDVVLQFALTKDEVGLRGVYLRLDQSFNPQTEQKKLDAFVKTCLDLKQEMFNE